MREKAIQDRIRVAVSRAGATMFRNNTGQAWTGNQVERLPGGKVVIYEARPITFGLCKGSSDLIGWTTVEITPDMVGQKIAVFTAVEVKGPKGRATDDQANFLNVILRAGGKAGIAKSESDATEIIKGEMS